MFTIPMTMAFIGMAAQTIGTAYWLALHISYATRNPFSTSPHIIQATPLLYIPLIAKVCFSALPWNSVISLGTMSPKNNVLGNMETDEIIPNDESISTKVIEETFDLKPQLPAEVIPLATTPYSGLLGTGEAFLQDDLIVLTQLMARVCLKTPMLYEAQILQCKMVEMLSTDWLLALPNQMHPLTLLLF